MRLTDASLRTGDTVTGRFTATLSGTMTPGVRRHSRRRFEVEVREFAVGKTRASSQSDFITPS